MFMLYNEIVLHLVPGSTAIELLLTGSPAWDIFMDEECNRDDLYWRRLLKVFTQVPPHCSFRSH